MSRNHYTKKEPSETHWIEPETPLKKLPFNLTLDVDHRLDGDLSEHEKNYLITLESAFHVEAIFWLLYQINEHGDFNSQNINKDEMMIHSAFICKIGAALARKTASGIDKINASLLFEEQDEDSIDYAEECRDFGVLVTVAKMVTQLQIKPEEALKVARENGLPEIKLSRFLKFLEDIKENKKRQRKSAKSEVSNAE